MFDSKSDFALNKLDKEAIVYKSVTGEHIRLTRADFASEDEFQLWKNLSDSDYMESENAGRGFYDYCVSLEEAWNTTGVSAEDVLFAPMLKAEQKELRTALLRQVRSVLTKTQYRRLWMYYVEAKSAYEIAEIEGASFQAVYICLARAKKTIVDKL